MLEFYNFFVESPKIIYERHKYSVLWLTDYRNAQNSRLLHGLMVRCIDPRVHRVLSTDSLSRIIGKVAEIRSFGANFDIENPVTKEIIRKLLVDIGKLIMRKNIDRGVLYIEGHSDCAFIRALFTGELIRVKDKHILITKDFLEKILGILHDPQIFRTIMDQYEEYGSTTRLNSGVDLRELFDPKEIYDQTIRNLVKKTASPYYTYLKLHMFIGHMHIFYQALRTLRNTNLYNTYYHDNLRILTGYYDIFSANLYLYQLKPKQELSNITERILSNPINIPKMFIKIF